MGRVPDTANLLTGWIRYPLLFALFFSLYLLYGQGTFYKADGQLITLLVATGDPKYPTHVLMVPVLIAMRDLWLLLGLPEISPYRIGTILSALSGALAVLCVRRIGRLIRLPGAFGWFAALLAGLTPAPFFFATVVEFHAFHGLFATLSVWAATSLALRPSARRALTLAGAMLLGYLSHTSGALLPVLCLPWAVALGWSRRAAVLKASGVALGAFVVLLIATGWLSARLGVSTPGVAAGYFAHFAAPQDLWIRFAALPRVVMREFLVPYFPLWLLVPLGLLVHGGAGKRLVIALLFPFAAYLVLCAVLLWDDPESGAYFIPMVAPLALVSAAGCSMLSTGKTGHGLAFIGCLVATIASIVLVSRHDKPDEHRAWIGSMRTITQEQPTLLIVGSKEDVDAMLLSGAPTHSFVTIDLVLRDDPASAAARAREAITATLGDGRAVILTAAAADFLERNRHPQIGAYLEMERQHFVRERVELGAFVGFRLKPR
jgi:hypothetical protein